MDQGCVYLFLVAAVIILLYKRSNVFKYYFKFSLFGIGSTFSVTVFIPIMLLRPRDSRNALMPAWGCRQVTKLLGVNWEMKGHKNIVQDEGTVILMNHQSFLDLMVLANIWPVFKRCTVISKREIFYLWPFGLGAWLWGTVFINRSSRNDALAGVNKAASTITTQRSKICFFPEGTRHGGEKLLPFKKGAFVIAVQSQAPIQPIVARRYFFLDHKNKIFDEGTSMISILPAIPTKGLGKDDIPDLIEKVHEAMEKEYQSLNSQFKQAS